MVQIDPKNRGPDGPQLAIFMSDSISGSGDVTASESPGLFLESYLYVHDLYSRRCYPVSNAKPDFRDGMRLLIFALERILAAT
jgi:hypothetical protein